MIEGVMVRKILFAILLLFYGTLFSLDEKNPEIFFQNGMKAISEKNYDSAIDYLEKYVRQTNNPMGKYQLGKAYLFAGKNLEKAVQIYKNYIKRFHTFDNKYRLPDINAAYWRLGLVYERMGNFEKAKAIYRKALKYDNLNGLVLAAQNNIGKNIERILSPPDYLQKEEALFDLNYLFTVLKNCHPNLYAAADKNQVENDFERIKSTLPDSLSLIEFAKIAASFTAEFNDGHTSVYLPYWTFYENPEGKAFPFDVIIQDGKVLIDNAYNKADSAFIGYEILSVNNKDISSILKDILQCISAEKKAFKYQIAARMFRETLFLFYGWQDTFDLKLKNPETEEIVTAEITGIEKSLIQNRQKQNSIPDDKPFEFRYLEDINAALIDYRSFSQKDNFKVFLDSTFKFIREKNIKNLIIDIRKNGGGNSTCGDLFLSYLNRKPYMMYSRVDVKYSRKVKNLYKLNIPKFFRIFPFYFLRQQSRIIYTKKDGYIYREKIKPYKHDVYEPIFDGNIYLLIGNYTFSSAADFAAVFKDFSLGTLVGEETGGLATSYGDVLPFIMPYSQLNFGVSHKYFVRPAGFDDGKGVLPDYEVKQTSADLKAGIDTVLKFTENLIEKNSKTVDK